MVTASTRKEYTHWTDEAIVKTAKKYKTPDAFRKALPYVYNKAEERGLLKKAFRKDVPVRQKRSRRENGYWTRETMLREARKYETLKELRESNVSLYIMLHRNGLLSELKIASNRVKRGHWNVFDNVKEEAMKYSRRSEFSKGSTSAYQSAVRHGWIDKLHFSGE